MIRGLGSLAQGLSMGLATETEIRNRRDRAEAERLAATSGAIAAPGGGAFIPATPGMTGPRGVFAPPAATPPGPNALSGPAGGPAPATRASGLFNLIDRHEGAGNYDTLFGHSQNDGRQFGGVRVSQMTLGQLRDFASTSGAYGRWVRDELGRSGQRPRIATPMGRHQIVGTTLRSAAAALGMGDDTVFDQGTQDRIATYLAQQRLQGARTPAGRRAALRAEWEGFRNVSDRDLDAAINQFMGS